MRATWRALSTIGRMDFFHRVFTIEVSATHFLVESCTPEGVPMARIGVFGNGATRVKGERSNER